MIFEDASKGEICAQFESISSSIISVFVRLSHYKQLVVFFCELITFNFSKIAKSVFLTFLFLN